MLRLAGGRHSGMGSLPASRAGCGTSNVMSARRTASPGGSGDRSFNNAGNVGSDQHDREDVAAYAAAEKMFVELLKRTFWPPGPILPGGPYNQLLSLRGPLAQQFYKRFAQPPMPILCLTLVNRDDQVLIAGAGPFFSSLTAPGLFAVCLNPAPQYGRARRPRSTKQWNGYGSRSRHERHC